MSDLTKAQLRSALDLLGVAYAPKSNHAQLSALYATATALPPEAPVLTDEHGTAQPVDEQPLVPLAAVSPIVGSGTGSGLKIEKEREERNGIKRPSIGGKCRAVWDACDAFAIANGTDPTASDVRNLAVAEGWNPNNASIEFYQWRKFNGIRGRTPKPAAVAAD